MYSRITTVINETGLHARPASDFMRAAMKFRSNIQIGPAGGTPRVNAKSILMILGLGIRKGAEVEISAEGEDQKEAVDSLVELIESGFGE